jgi:hypothetical protein
MQLIGLLEAAGELRCMDANRYVVVASGEVMSHPTAQDVLSLAVSEGVEIA